MIHTDKLAYAYTPTKVLDGVQAELLRFPDIDAAQGSVVLLKGASGSGKSTWLALACGLLTATAGSIVVAEQNASALKGAQRDAWRGRSIGFLPQRLHLSESLSVFDNLSLAYFAAGVKEDKAHITQCLQALGVADLAARMPHELSGGQAQRVALARAVLLQPQVILADEPTASLDDAAAAQAVALMLEQARRCSATLVIATHDARVQTALVAAECAFKPVFMHENRLQPNQGMRKQL